MNQDDQNHQDQNQNQPNQTDEKQELSEKDLDHLQIQWILGKNRGVEAPLTASELKKLIESNRIKMQSLSLTEVNSLKTTNFKNFDLRKSAGDEKFSIETIVEGLKFFLLNDYLNMVSFEEWKAMNTQERETLRELLFKMTYGFFPTYYSERIKLRNII